LFLITKTGTSFDPLGAEGALGDEQLREGEELEALGPQAIALVMQEARVVVRSPPQKPVDDGSKAVGIGEGDGARAAAQPEGDR
jgi:hypothetical protein